MPLRSITQKLGLRRDKRPIAEVEEAAVKRLSYALENDGASPIDLKAISNVAREAASESPGFSAATRAAMAEYLGALPEPQRSMYRQRDEGMSVFDIANRMEMTPKAVARSLAKIYSNLRLL